jgi:acid phosphatase
MGGVIRRVAASACVLLLAACVGSPGQHRGGGRQALHGQAAAGANSPAAATGPAVPRFAHIVVVIEENHSFGEVIGNSQAPYINALARSGALLARSYGITHPSEPNYLALFSGSTHGLTDDSCPHVYHAQNLGAELRSHGMSFVGYAESLPSTGYLGCSAGTYARKHAPWTDFANLPTSVGKPMSAFPSHYARLPRVAFVVPNLEHDMHDGTIAQADSWLHSHLAGYLRWARLHNSLLVVTWDEDDRSASNHIPGVLAGAHVRHLRYRGRVDHYTVLRTIEAACGLPAIGRAAFRAPIRGVWTP